MPKYRCWLTEKNSQTLQPVNFFSLTHSTNALLDRQY